VSVNTSHETERVPGQVNVPLGGACGDPVTRNGEGQRLDDARAEFRAAWQVMMKRKKRQAKFVKGLLVTFHLVAGLALVVGMGVGGGMGFAVGQRSPFLEELVLSAGLGVLLGFGVSLPVVVVALLCASVCVRFITRARRLIEQFGLGSARFRLAPRNLKHQDALNAIGSESSSWQATSGEVRTRSTPM